MGPKSRSIAPLKTPPSETAAPPPAKPPVRALEPLDEALQDIFQMVLVQKQKMPVLRNFTLPTQRPDLNRTAPAALKKSSSAPHRLQPIAQKSESKPPTAAKSPSAGQSPAKDPDLETPSPYTVSPIPADFSNATQEPSLPPVRPPASVKRLRHEDLCDLCTADRQRRHEQSVMGFTAKEQAHRVMIMNAQSDMFYAFADRWVVETAVVRQLVNEKRLKDEETASKEPTLHRRGSQGMIVEQLMQDEKQGRRGIIMDFEIGFDEWAAYHRLIVRQHHHVVEAYERSAQRKATEQREQREREASEKLLRMTTMQTKERDHLFTLEDRQRQRVVMEQLAVVTAMHEVFISLRTGIRAHESRVEGMLAKHQQRLDNLESEKVRVVADETIAREKQAVAERKAFDVTFCMEPDLRRRAATAAATRLKREAAHRDEVQKSENQGRNGVLAAETAEFVTLRDSFKKELDRTIRLAAKNSVVKARRKWREGFEAQCAATMQVEDDRAWIALRVALEAEAQQPTVPEEERKERKSLMDARVQDVAAVSDRLSRRETFQMAELRARTEVAKAEEDAIEEMTGFGVLPALMAEGVTRLSIEQDLQCFWHTVTTALQTSRSMIAVVQANPAVVPPPDVLWNIKRPTISYFYGSRPLAMLAGTEIRSMAPVASREGGRKLSSKVIPTFNGGMVRAEILNALPNDHLFVGSIVLLPCIHHRPKNSVIGLILPTNMLKVFTDNLMFATYEDPAANPSALLPRAVRITLEKRDFDAEGGLSESQTPVRHDSVVVHINVTKPILPRLNPSKGPVDGCAIFAGGLPFLKTLTFPTTPIKSFRISVRLRSTIPAHRLDFTLPNGITNTGKQGVMKDNKQHIGKSLKWTPTTFDMDFDGTPPALTAAAAVLEALVFHYGEPCPTFCNPEAVVIWVAADGVETSFATDVPMVPLRLNDPTWSTVGTFLVDTNFKLLPPPSPNARPEPPGWWKYMSPWRPAEYIRLQKAEVPCRLPCPSNLSQPLLKYIPRANTAMFRHFQLNQFPPIVGGSVSVSVSVPGFIVSMGTPFPTDASEITVDTSGLLSVVPWQDPAAQDAPRKPGVPVPVGHIVNAADKFVLRLDTHAGVSVEHLNIVLRSIAIRAGISVTGDELVMPSAGAPGIVSLTLDLAPTAFAESTVFVAKLSVLPSLLQSSGVYSLTYLEGGGPKAIPFLNEIKGSQYFSSGARMDAMIVSNSDANDNLSVKDAVSYKAPQPSLVPCTWQALEVKHVPSVVWSDATMHPASAPCQCYLKFHSPAAALPLSDLTMPEAHDGSTAPVVVPSRLYNSKTVSTEGPSAGAINILLRSLCYNSLSPTPSRDPRVLLVSLDDGVTGVSSVAFAISVDQVDDPTELILAQETVVYCPGSKAANTGLRPLKDAALDDPDSDNFHGGFFEMELKTGAADLGDNLYILSPDQQMEADRVENGALSSLALEDNVADQSLDRRPTGGPATRSMSTDSLAASTHSTPGSAAISGAWSGDSSVVVGPKAGTLVEESAPPLKIVELLGDSLLFGKERIGVVRRKMAPVGPKDPPGTVPRCVGMRIQFMNERRFISFGVVESVMQAFGFENHLPKFRAGLRTLTIALSCGATVTTSQVNVNAIPATIALPQDLVPKGHRAPLWITIADDKPKAILKAAISCSLPPAGVLGAPTGKGLGEGCTLRCWLTPENTDARDEILLETPELKVKDNKITSGKDVVGTITARVSPQELVIQLHKGATEAQLATLVRGICFTNRSNHNSGVVAAPSRTEGDILPLPTRFHGTRRAFLELCLLPTAAECTTRISIDITCANVGRPSAVPTFHKATSSSTPSTPMIASSSSSSFQAPTRVAFQGALLPVFDTMIMQELTAPAFTIGGPGDQAKVLPVGSIIEVSMLRPPVAGERFVVKVPAEGLSAPVPLSRSESRRGSLVKLPPAAPANPVFLGSLKFEKVEADAETPAHFCVVSRLPGEEASVLAVVSELSVAEVLTASGGPVMHQHFYFTDALTFKLVRELPYAEAALILRFVQYRISESAYAPPSQQVMVAIREPSTDHAPAFPSVASLQLEIHPAVVPYAFQHMVSQPLPVGKPILLFPELPDVRLMLNDAKVKIDLSLPRASLGDTIELDAGLLMPPPPMAVPAPLFVQTIERSGDNIIVNGQPVGTISKSAGTLSISIASSKLATIISDICTCVLRAVTMTIAPPASLEASSPVTRMTVLECHIAACASDFHRTLCLKVAD